MKERIGWRALARYFSGESSAEEAAAIRAWAQRDDRHAEILESSRRAWELSQPEPLNWDADAAWQTVAAQLEPAASPAASETRAPRFRPKYPWAWAAALAALLALPLAWVLLAQRDAGETFVTAANEQRTVRLEDGSVVRLAGNTRLRVAPDGRRETWLEGTAFFGIAERNGEPFVVHTPAGEARVLGTRFELRADDEHVRLAVLEGRVALAGAGKQALVQAGQVSQADAGAGPSAPQPADVHQLVGWMGAVLIFQDTPLQQAAEEMERLYGVPVRITDAELGQRTLTAAFDRQTISDVADTVCRVVDARCDVQDTVVIVSR